MDDEFKMNGAPVRSDGHTTNKQKTNYVCIRTNSDFLIYDIYRYKLYLKFCTAQKNVMTWKSILIHGKVVKTEMKLKGNVDKKRQM